MFRSNRSLYRFISLCGCLMVVGLFGPESLFALFTDGQNRETNGDPSLPRVQSGVSQATGSAVTGLPSEAAGLKAKAVAPAPGPVRHPRPLSKL